jgi:hypothetical protein
MVDVDKIHTLEYEKTTFHVEEEKEPAQEPKQQEEDVEQTKSDASRGKRLQQEESTIGSMQWGLDSKLEHETKKEAIQEGGVLSPQWKNKVREKRIMQGIQCTQEN